jgi:hypothetical protein
LLNRDLGQAHLSRRASLITKPVEDLIPNAPHLGEKSPWLAKILKQSGGSPAKNRGKRGLQGLARILPRAKLKDA